MKGRRPLAGPALFLGTGVALGAWLPPFAPHWSAAASAAALLAWLGAARSGRTRSRAAAAAATFLLIGMFRFHSGTSAVPYTGVDPLAGDAVAAGTVAHPPEVRHGTMIFEIDRARVRSAGKTYTTSGRIRVYLGEASEKYRTGEKLLLRGRLLPVRGERNLSWFPSSSAPSSRALTARLFVNSPVWIRRQGSQPGGGVAAAVTRLREEASSFWDRRGGEEAALLKALTTGQRSAVSDSVREDFRRSGLAHLLAVSGLHLGFLGFFVYFLVRRALSWVEPLVARYPVQPIAALATMPFLVFVYAFSGQQVSAGRAVVMACLALGASVVCRRTDLVNLVACAALAMLFAEPHLLFSVSFQLSFAAVTALVLAAPRLAGKPRGDAPPRPAARLVRYCAGVFLASLVASAGTLPLVAFHFQRIPLVGTAVNVAAVPLTGFAVLPLGWAALAAQSLWPGAADLAADAASWACRGLILLAHAAAGPSWISVAVPRPPPLLVAALLGLLGLLLAGPLKRVLRGALCALAVLALLSSLWWAGSLRRTEIRMSFFDVGQGEAALLQLPGGEGVLVDTGPSWEHGDAGRSIVVPALRRLGVTSLDALVVSHFHPDHCGGLLSVMNEMPVKELWVAPFKETDLPPGLAAALHRWEQEGGKLRTFARGDTWRGREGIRIDFLNPPKPPYGGRDFHQSMNDNSLAFLLRWKKIHLLMTGDAGASPVLDISRLLPEARGLSILKVPHHGGRQAGTGELARSYIPRYAVISVGRNNYGHPDPEVVETYGATADVLRTDREGGIFLSSGGSSLKARTWREMAEGRTWSARVRWLVEGR